MANVDLSTALNDCIDRLAKGQSLEDCLHTYPDHAQELRPMLEAGFLVRHTRVSPGEIAQAKDRVRFQLEEHRRERRSIRPIGLARISGSMLIVTLLVAVGLGLLAENSLPGDLLYGVKRLTENVRQFASGNTLGTQFAQRRVSEVATLLAQKRVADVVFDGELTAINGSIWTVAGIPVKVAPTTQGASSVKVSDQIEVQGSTTTDGEVIARRISLLTASEPTPTFTYTPTVSPTIPQSATPTYTPTQTLTLTSSPSPTATITPSATPTMAPPAIVTIAPTQRPPATVPPDPPAPTDDHGGGSGNSGSGSGSSGKGGGGSDGSGD